MKRSRFLSLSLALNAALAAAVVLLASRQTPAPSTSDAGPSQTAPKPADLPVSPAPLTPSANFSQWLQQSHAAGVPGHLLAELVIADFNRRWNQRQRDFDRRYWRGYENNESRLRLEQEREFELENALRSALGEQVWVEWEQSRMFADLGFENLDLSVSEKDALYRLQKEWKETVRKFERRKISGELDHAAYEQQFAAAAEEFEQRRKAVLGDERWASLYEPRDHFYVELRSHLGNAALSDTEFDALAQTARATDEALAEIELRFSEGRMAAEDREAGLLSLESARQAEFQKILGPEAFADFQKRRDSRYQTLKQYAAALQLTTADVDYLYQVARNYETSTREYKRRAILTEQEGQPVDWESVEQNLQQFTQQTEQVLRAYLGDEQFSNLNPADILVESAN